MRIRDLYRVLLAATAIGTPAVAFAHPGGGAGHDLVHGFMHPLGGLDHVLAMVAVGMLAAQLGGRALWALPASFIAAMALAGACGMAGLSLSHAEIGIALSVVVLGIAVAFPARLPITLAAAGCAVFAVFHGYAHGLEMNGVASGIAFGCGFIAATALLHGAGIGLGVALDRVGGDRHLQMARFGGSAIALAGVAILTGNLIGWQ